MTAKTLGDTIKAMIEARSKLDNAVIIGNSRSAFDHKEEYDRLVIVMQDELDTLFKFAEEGQRAFRGEHARLG